MAKAVVCKTIIHRFDSDRRLQLIQGLVDFETNPFFIPDIVAVQPHFIGVRAYLCAIRLDSICYRAILKSRTEKIPDLSRFRVTGKLSVDLNS